MKRTTFIKSIGAAAVTLASNATTGGAITTQGFHQNKTPLAPTLVKEFVIAGHGNFEKVRMMLEAEPGLLNSSWDWGSGDFEEAIEGAAHVGNREIALYLIDKGARMNIFTAAMLGNVQIVKEILALFPTLVKARGPHGLDLAHHARAGGKYSKDVLDFLNSIK